ncbi:MAG: VacJ family lipoprotein [Deltaproteobacteria bacterium]|nr:VacJ family lipoprotein [Deltaproteobacteria bacterium]
MKHIPLIFFLFFFFSSGGALRPAVDSCSAFDDLPYDQNRKIISTTEKQPSLNGTVSDENFFDHEIDLLDEWEEEPISVADPLAPWNRLMFHFNDKFYFWILKPVSKGYKALTPQIVRTGVRNFFFNITAPIRLVNCVVQGKGEAAAGEFARFVVNSTIGVLGFGNPAKTYPEFNPDEEDMGQSFGAYGIGNGFYIVWPFLGPSTLRDSVGLIGDSFLNPVNYVSPTEASLGITGFKTVNNTSMKIGEYESFKETAFEPYEALRNAYIQNRKKMVEE